MHTAQAWHPFEGAGHRAPASGRQGLAPKGAHLRIVRLTTRIVLAWLVRRGLAPQSAHLRIHRTTGAHRSRPRRATKSRPAGAPAALPVVGRSSRCPRAPRRSRSLARQQGKEVSPRRVRTLISAEQRDAHRSRPRRATKSRPAGALAAYRLVVGRHVAPRAPRRARSLSTRAPPNILFLFIGKSSRGRGRAAFSGKKTPCLIF